MYEPGFLIRLTLAVLIVMVLTSLYGWYWTHARDERQVARRLRTWVGRR